MSCGCSAVLGRVAVTSERSCGELRALFFLTSTFKNVRAQPLSVSRILLSPPTLPSARDSLCRSARYRDTAPGFYPLSALREARAEDGGITREYCVLGVGVSLTLSKKTNIKHIAAHVRCRRSAHAMRTHSVYCSLRILYRVRRHGVILLIFASFFPELDPRDREFRGEFKHSEKMCYVASCRRACGVAGCWGPLVPQGPLSRERQHDLFRRRGKDLYKHRPTAAHPQRAGRRPGVQDSTRLHGSWPHHAS